MQQSHVERLDRSVMAALCLSAVAGLMNNVALGPFIPDIAADFDSSVPVVGQAATASWTMAALAGVFAGPLADHYGHRRFLIVGLALTAISALGGALATSFWPLVITRIVGGIGFSSTVGIAFALATSRYCGATRQRAVGAISSSLSLGAVLGIPVLTMIAGPFSWRGSWVFVSLIALTAIFILIRNVRPVASRIVTRFSAMQLRTAYAPLLHSRKMLLLLAGSTGQGVLFLSALTYLGAFYIEGLGLTVQQFGLIATVTGVAFFLGSVVGGRLTRYDLRTVLASTTLISGALFCIAFAWASSVLVATGLLSVGIFFGGLQVVNIITLISDESTAEQGTTLVFNESMFGMGAATGAATGGLLISLGGFAALGFGMPVAAILTAGVVWASGHLPAMPSTLLKDFPAAAAPTLDGNSGQHR